MNIRVEQLKRGSISPSSAIKLVKEVLEEGPENVFKGEDMGGLVKKLLDILANTYNYSLLFKLMKEYENSEYEFIAVEARKKINEVNRSLNNMLLKK